MAQDLVGLYNLALSACGTRNLVSLPGEKSREAEICDLHYPVTRDLIMSAAHWTSLKAAASLPLAASRDQNSQFASGDPLPNWLYAYGLPSDYLHPRYINSFTSFEIGVHNNARALFSNASVTVLTYTRRVEVLQLLEPNLYHAIAYALAAAISLSLHGKVSRAKLNIEMANRHIIEARANDANKDFKMFESIPPWLAARGVTQPGAISEFIYPHGPLLTEFAAPVS